MSRHGWQRLIKLVAAAFGALFLLVLLFRLADAAWQAITPRSFVVALATLACASAVYGFIWIRLQFARAKRIRNTAHTHSRGEMMFLSPRDFEHFVGGLYDAKGYRATVTRESGDGGIDIVLEGPGGWTGIQVKHYKHARVGRPEIHQLAGACRERGFAGMIFVTSSDFSAEAREAAETLGMELIDGESLEAMAIDVFGPQFRQRTISFGIERRMRQLDRLM